MGQTEAMDKLIITLGPIIIEAGTVAIILTLTIVGTVAMVNGFISKDCPEGNNVDWGDRGACPGRKTC